MRHSATFGYSEQRSAPLFHFARERSRGFVIPRPSYNFLAGIIEANKQCLIQRFVTPPPVQTLHERLLGWLARSRKYQSFWAAPRRSSMAFAVGSIPLSPTIMLGLPHFAMRLLSLRTARLPEIDVSGTAARQSKVTWSTTLIAGNRRPISSFSKAKWSLQCWLGSVGTAIGAWLADARPIYVLERALLFFDS